MRSKPIYDTEFCTTLINNVYSLATTANNQGAKNLCKKLSKRLDLNQSLTEDQLSKLVSVHNSLMRTNSR